MNLNDPQTPQKPQTRSHTFPEPPGAPQSSHLQHLLRIRHDVEHVGEAVPAILLEFLARCEPNTKYHATLNDAAKKARFDEIPWNVRPWNDDTVDKHSLPDLFAKAVTRYHHLVAVEKTIADWDPQHDVKRSQQRPKLLILEGDVADSANSSKLDHAIYLTEISPREGKDYQLQLPLVVIEEKAPGIVRDEDWRPHPLHPRDSSANWMHLLLPQLFLYAHRTGCHRFFLTNYNTTVGVQMNLNELNDAAKALDGKAQMSEVEIRTRSCTTELKEHSKANHHPYSYGFRMALAFEVFMALSDLGVADYALLDKELAKHHHYKVDDRITKHVKTPLHARRDSMSPSSRYGEMTYSNPPPSP
ncbi:hypothetical protein JCM5353_005169 [Sporobolomyces roseus]